MSQEDPKPHFTRAELIAVHRQRYRMHAQAALDGVKEFKVRDDCGVNWLKVDHPFINGMESKLPPHLQGEAGRRLLCAAIAANEPTPELDARLDSYCTVLTGKAA